MTQLSPHFTVAEMILSRTAIRRGIDQTPSAKVKSALTALCVNVLEPVRVHFNRPVIVTSGYRSPTLNRRIGGAARSQHVSGEAADFTVAGMSNIAVCKWMEKNLNYDQLIYEHGEGGWIHVSYGPRMRNQELSARKVSGRTRYFAGLGA